jgi:hypothetical protein
MRVEELKAGFARLADPVVPAEDPYQRLLRRARRSRRGRIAAWTSVIAAGVVAALLTPLLVQASGSPEPTPSVDVQDGFALTPWVQRLLNSPTRGSLAADRGLISTLTDRLPPQVFAFSPELGRRKVLFAGDVGTYRVVLLAYSSDTRQMGMWLIGDARASAAQLVAAAAAIDYTKPRPTPFSGPAGSRVLTLATELKPFSDISVNDPENNRYLAIGVAPAGCQVATKDPTHPQTWRDEATAGYVERADKLGTTHSAFARATCDGVVRYQGPISNLGFDLSAIGLTDRQLDAMSAGARGTPPSPTVLRTLLRGALASMARTMTQSLDSCTVPFAGPVPVSADTPPLPGGAPPRAPLVLITCPIPGGTLFQVLAEPLGGGMQASTGVRLSDPHAVLTVPDAGPQDQETAPPTGAIASGQPSPDDYLLVLAPSSATTLQVVQGGRVVRSIALTDGVGSITVPAGEKLQLRALDPAGTVVGSGTSWTDQGMPGSPMNDADATIDNWS